MLPNSGQMRLLGGVAAVRRYSDPMGRYAYRNAKGILQLVPACDTVFLASVFCVPSDVLDTSIGLLVPFLFALQSQGPPKAPSPGGKNSAVVLKF